MFWEYHDLIFADQTSTRSTLDDARLTAMAVNLGMDEAAFTECLSSDKYTTQIQQESLTVQSLGVRGTPAFFINGVYVAGAQPYEVFRQIVNEQLAQLGSEPVEAQPTEPPRSSDEIPGLVVFPSQSQLHKSGEVTYADDVPAGGIHSDVWQNCGIYTEPVATGNVMHSLEHGAAWVAYNPEKLSAEDVGALQNVVRQQLQANREPMVILSPKTGLSSPIVATAWQAQLTLDAPDDPRLVQFLEMFQVGPYTPEPGAPCTGGVGNPTN